MPLKEREKIIQNSPLQKEEEENISWTAILLQVALTKLSTYIVPNVPSHTIHHQIEKPKQPKKEVVLNNKSCCLSDTMNK